MTKKEFIEYLNEIGCPELDKVKNGGRCRSNRYGEWLYKNDPTAFNVGFFEFCLKDE